MSNDMKCQMTWNVKWHEISNDMKCQMIWNVKCQMIHDSWYILHDTWYMIHDSWYTIHDTWYMIHDTWYMIHDTWYMIHDTWYMIHDTWYMIHDVDARSMTPSRNTRSYTLRSVPSSPGRSFLAPKELFTWWWPIIYIDRYTATFWGHTGP